MSTEVPMYCCALLGDPETGKTSFAKRHLTGEFVNSYNANKIYQTYLLEFHTSLGDIRYTLWNANQIDDFDCLHIQCAIIMTDFSCTRTYQRVPVLQTAIHIRYGNIPVALCANKMDLGRSNGMAYRLIPDHPKQFEYFHISVKKNVNCEQPFLWLSRRLLDNDQLEFVAKPAVQPPDIPPAHWKTAFKGLALSQLPPIGDDEW